MKLLICLSLLFTSLAATADDREVPFGDKIDARITNYNRTTPWLATAGEPGEGGIALLAELGFKSIVDLRTPEEGTATEARLAREHDLEYVNIPVGKEAPDTFGLDRFRQWIEDPDKHPVLVHCASANRVGTLWAMYRLREGVPLDEALLEARTIGMKDSREPQVRDFASRLKQRQ